MLKRKIKIGLIFNIFLLAIFLSVMYAMYSFVNNERSQAGKVVSKETYSGIITGYKATINHYKYESGYSKRVVQLTPLDHYSMLKITGIDYNYANSNGVWEWDQVGRKRLYGGHNSVLRTTSGWEWQPCIADAERINPFTTEQINCMINLLNEAMETVYTKGSQI